MVVRDFHHILRHNRATEDAARTAARAACANNKGAPEAVRSTCAVVTTFRNQCLAVAGRSWTVAADEQAARDEASAKCRDATDANVREAICRTVNSVCDTSPKSRTSRGKRK